jgi:hypothetical protein
MNKTTIKNIIQDFARDKNYLSLAQVKNYLNQKGYEYAEVSIKKYVKTLVDEKILFDAGRGYYSTIQSVFILATSLILSLIKLVEEKFPLLDFSVWSTKQISFAFHHLQNRFFTFIYADKDSLVYLRDYLVGKDYPVFLNPTKKDLEKTVFVKEDSLILRQQVSRSKSKEHAASIEKILVDLYLEADRLNLVDKSEYSRIFQYFIQNYRLNISSLLDYAERRKILNKIKQFLGKYTNATFS